MLENDPVRKLRYGRVTWHFDWGILNECVDPATPATGPVDSPLDLSP